jgi:hypothetical protein
MHIGTENERKCYALPINHTICLKTRTPSTSYQQASLSLLT